MIVTQDRAVGEGGRGGWRWRRSDWRLQAERWSGPDIRRGLRLQRAAADARRRPSLGPRSPEREAPEARGSRDASPHPAPCRAPVEDVWTPA